MSSLAVQELKTAHSDLKSKYDAVKSQHETQRNDLERSVTALRGEMTGHETRMFQLQNQIDVRTDIFASLGELMTPEQNVHLCRLFFFHGKWICSLIFLLFAVCLLELASHIRFLI